jgi:hypothetical protein
MQVMISTINSGTLGPSMASTEHEVAACTELAPKSSRRTSSVSCSFSGSLGQLALACRCSCQGTVLDLEGAVVVVRLVRRSSECCEQQYAWSLRTLGFHGLLDLPLCAARTRRTQASLPQTAQLVHNALQRQQLRSVRSRDRDCINLLTAV